MQPRTKIRLRHTRNLLLRVAILPAALLLTWTIWSLESTHRLSTLKAQLHAQQIPTELADYLPAPLPDDQNAFTPFLHAAENVSLSSPDQALLANTRDDGPAFLAAFTPQETAAIDKALASLAPTFADLDEIARRPGAAWPAQTVDPLAEWPEIRGHSLRYFAYEFASCALMAARRAADRHDEPAAFQNMHRVLILARLFDTNPNRYAHSSASSLRTLVNTALATFTPALRFTAADLPAAQEFLKDLADENSFRNGALRSQQFELVEIQTSINQLNALDSPLLHPLAADEIARAYAFDSRFLPPSASSFFSTSLLPIYPHTSYGVIPEVDTAATDDAAPTDSRTLQFFRILADTRASRILLAARIHQQTTGRYPASLGDMADILPAAPLDPFDPAQAPMRYRLDPAGPTTWSVGRDNTDNHAVPDPAPNRANRYQQPDFVYGAAWPHAFNAPSTTRPSP